MKKIVWLFIISPLLLFSQTQTTDIIYSEDFSDPHSPWIEYNGSQYTSISDGLLHIKSTKKDALRWFASQIFIDYRKNFTIETKIKQVSGAKNQGYGLSWGAKGWDFSYFFLITSNGYFTVGSYVAGKLINIKKWTKTTAVKPFDFNVLKVEKQGYRYVFYINGQSVYTCRFTNFFGQMHGFMLQKNVQADVDYLKIISDKRIVDIATPEFVFSRKENLGTNINTIYTEIAPIISPDGKTLYFARVGHPQNIGKQKECDIWYSQRQADSSWGPARHFKYPLNNKGVNAVFSVTPDGNALLLEGLYNKDGSFKSEQGVSISYKTKDGWSVPVPLKIDGFYNLNQFETYTISDDLSVLIMAIETKDSYGDTDLYISFRKSDGSYTKPRNLGPVINTPGSEATPFLASDKKTLYFCSDGHPGFGSCDIFMTKRLDDTWLHWSKPKNLGKAINTSGWDSYFSISAKGDEAYLVSTKNSYGYEDIFVLKLNKEVRPEPVVLLYGKVLDKETNKPVAATITYYDLKTGKQIGIARSDPNTGDYKITLPYGKKYSFSAQADNFIAISETMNLSKQGQYKEIEKNLYLVPAKVGKIIVLKNIYFKRASAELLPESYVELDRLVKILNDNPNMKIEIRGHTDNRGDPDELMKLSRQRAVAVRNYLIQQGIDSTRLTVKAFGGSKPVTNSNSEQARAKNRRVEFKILELK